MAGTTETKTVRGDRDKCVLDRVNSLRWRLLPQHRPTFEALVFPSVVSSRGIFVEPRRALTHS